MSLGTDPDLHQTDGSLSFHLFRYQYQFQDWQLGLVFYEVALLTISDSELITDN